VFAPNHILGGGAAQPDGSCGIPLATTSSTAMLPNLLHKVTAQIHLGERGRQLVCPDTYLGRYLRHSTLFSTSLCWPFATFPNILLYQSNCHHISVTRTLSNFALLFSRCVSLPCRPFLQQARLPPLPLRCRIPLFNF
jgi:hypothetical protein